MQTLRRVAAEYEIVARDAFGGDTRSRIRANALARLFVWDFERFRFRTFHVVGDGKLSK
jgi:hypothetical protein